MMQGKAKWVKWGPSILALLIVWLTTFAGELLDTRASVSLDRKTKQSCELVKVNKANTHMIVDGSIPDAIEDLLNGDSGSQKFGLRCKKNTQTTSGNATPPAATASSVVLPIGSPLPLEGATPGGNPLPIEGATPGGNPLPIEGATPGGSPLPIEGATPGGNPLPIEGATPGGSPLPIEGATPGGNTSPALVSVNCVPQNNQEVCSITAPPGAFSAMTANGAITCTVMNNVLECKGTGVIPIIKSILGITLPADGSFGCTLQNLKLVCTGGAGVNAQISCTIQSGTADCKAPIPSNVSVNLPLNKTVTCTRQGTTVNCTTNAQPNSSNSTKFAAGDQFAASQLPICRLINNLKGNTQLRFASDIPSNIKDALDGKASLKCKGL